MTTAAAARRTVFVCRDPILEPVVDGISAELERRGVEVIRGPMPRLGEKLEYAPSQYEALFSRAEVAMFSMRSVASRAVLLAAPRLRGIVTPTIGLESVDLATADELGIIVGHGATPENFVGMAEATVMLMLMLSYQPRASEEAMKGSRPRPRPRPEESWARLLRGQTIGLVGFGRIARGVAERLASWNVRILAHDPHTAPSSLPPNVSLVDLDTLLRESDIVSVHVAVTPENRGMIGAREFGLMKADAYLINTARGEAIDEGALYQALKDRRIAGAALDTFEVEPLPADSPLRTLDNVILTPHIVGHTREAYASFIPAGVENIVRILAGELPLHCKNPHVEARWRARSAKRS